METPLQDWLSASGTNNFQFNKEDLFFQVNDLFGQVMAVECVLHFSPCQNIKALRERLHILEDDDTHMTKFSDVTYMSRLPGFNRQGGYSFSCSMELIQRMPFLHLQSYVDVSLLYFSVDGLAGLQVLFDTLEKGDFGLKSCLEMLNQQTM